MQTELAGEAGINDRIQGKDLRVRKQKEKRKEVV